MGHPEGWRVYYLLRKKEEVLIEKGMLNRPSGLSGSPGLAGCLCLGTPCSLFGAELPTYNKGGSYFGQAVFRFSLSKHTVRTTLHLFGLGVVLLGGKPV